MAFLKLQNRLLTFLMIVAMLVTGLSPTGGSTVHAQGAPGYVRRVRAIETGEIGIPRPAGLAFSPGASAFHVVEARGPVLPVPPDVDILRVTPFEEWLGSVRIPLAIRDPINMVFDGHANRLLIFHSAANKLFELLEGPDGNLDPTTLTPHDARHFGLEDPQGMAVDPASGHLFILDGVGPRIVRIEPNPEGGFDGAVVSEIELSGTGLADVRGLALDPDSGHFYLLGPSDQILYEVTEEGQIATTRDLSDFELIAPQGLVYAPSGDLTDDPARMSLYIADSGPATEQTQNLGPVESSQVGQAGNGAQGGTGNITEFSFYEMPAAAEADWTASLVRTVDTSTYDPPSPDPSGLAYLPASDTLLMCDGEVEETVSGVTHFEGVNVWETTLGGTVVDTANISKVAPTVVPMSNEPTGVAWNPVNGHFYFSDDGAKRVYDLAPGADGELGTADDTWTYFDTTAVGSEDPEGIAYDSWHDRLFVVDGVNMEVYEFTLAGSLDGQFDVSTYGISDPESVEFNTASGTLYILSSSQSNPVAVETTTGGALIQTIDVSAANPKAAAGLAYAPASDGSGAMRFYIVDRAVDNNSDPNIVDGKMYELTMPPIDNVAPTANDDSAGTFEGTAVTIDVAANDTDVNGNMNPASANTTCAYGSTGCSGVTHGLLANNGNGSFTYTPDAGYVGADGFVY